MAESTIRTTLNIDYDVLMAVKEVAASESKPVGVVVSDLLRRSLAHGTRETPNTGAGLEPEYGFRPFPQRGGVVTNELIDRLQDEIGD